MDYQTQLKVQAYVDGELSDAERRQIADLLARDPQARILCDELAMTRTAVAGNELPATLPEAGDFYWSKICREINRFEETVSPARFGSRFWLRWMLPVSGFAALAFAVTFSLHNTAPTIDETESTVPESSVVSFRSQAEKMSVVWVQTDENSPFTSSEPDGTIERNDND